jgi:hypothetical protein
VGHLQALLHWHLRHSARPSRGGHVAPAHFVSLKQPKRPQPCCCCASRGIREPARTTAPSLLREQGSACCRAVRPVGRNALLRYGLFALGPDRAARGAAGRERPGGSGRWARLGAGRCRPKPIPAPRAMRVVGGGWDELLWRQGGPGRRGAPGRGAGRQKISGALLSKSDGVFEVKGIESSLGEYLPVKSTALPNCRVMLGGAKYTTGP